MLTVDEPRVSHSCPELATSVVAEHASMMHSQKDFAKMDKPMQLVQFLRFEW